MVENGGLGMTISFSGTEIDKCSIGIEHDTVIIFTNKQER
jgi:hypothetical protein